jgi:predicted Fe-S protein YdhL (DUF1289 family)
MSAAKQVADILLRESAIKTLASRAVLARATVENIPSPCVSLCRMDTVSSLCEGCFRTIDEIRDWSCMDDARKKALWSIISTRLAQTHPAAFS